MKDELKELIEASELLVNDELAKRLECESLETLVTFRSADIRTLYNATKVAKQALEPEDIFQPGNVLKYNLRDVFVQAVRDKDISDRLFSCLVIAGEWGGVEKGSGGLMQCAKSEDWRLSSLEEAAQYKKELENKCK